jgi:hypothetical protein
MSCDGVDLNSTYSGVCQHFLQNAVIRLMIRYRFMTVLLLFTEYLAVDGDCFVCHACP